VHTLRKRPPGGAHCRRQERALRLSTSHVFPRLCSCRRTTVGGCARGCPGATFTGAADLASQQPAGVRDGTAVDWRGLNKANWERIMLAQMALPGARPEPHKAYRGTLWP